MTFEWMSSSPRPASARSDSGRTQQVRNELAQRAAMYYRLGYSQDRALGRLRANLDWDYQLGAARPAWLSDAEVAAIVDRTYKRRPSR